MKHNSSHALKSPESARFRPGFADWRHQHSATGLLLLFAMLLMTLSAHAGQRSSADYSIKVDAADNGGASAASSSYSSMGSAGSVVGITRVASPMVTSHNGFLGQLHVVAPTLSVVGTATNITGTSVTLNGSINANGSPVAAKFEYGLTTSYDQEAVVTLVTNNGLNAEVVMANITGLTPGTLYHFRLVAANAGGTSESADGAFTTLNNDAKLANFTLSSGTLDPVFDADTINYTATVSSATAFITVTPTVSDANATIEVNNAAAASGVASEAIGLNFGANTITTLVTAEDGVTTSTYATTVTRRTIQKILVEQPVDNELAGGANINLGTLGINVLNPTVFTIRNTGDLNLTGVAITITGAHASMFTITAQPSATVAPLESTTFTVQAKLASAGGKSATIRIASNDPTANPFLVNLTATGAAAVLPKATTGLASGLDFGVGVGIDIARATLNGSIDAKGQPRTVTFEYGLTKAYGSSVMLAGPFAANGVINVSAPLTGLPPHTLYHYRVRVDGLLGNALGADKTFTTANHAPIAVNDTVLALPSAAVAINVLGNDNDADGDALTISAKSAVAPATAGTLAIVANQLVFTAKPAFGTVPNATATFTYAIKDGTGATATASVTVNAGSAALDITFKAIEAEGNAFKSPRSYPVAITTDCTWTVTETVAWASASPLTGNGNGIVNITVQPNPTTAPRIGMIKIGGIDHTITQAAAKKPMLDATELPNGSLFNAVVGGYFELTIPTINAPVTYTSSNLPPGLTLSNDTGILSGRPTMTGSTSKNYNVTVSAKNAAGPLAGDSAGIAAATLSFIIHVEPLPAGVIGTFNGLVERSSTVNIGSVANLGARWQMTVTALGVVSGKITEGAATKNFTGNLEATFEGLTYPTLTAAVPGTDLILDLKLDSDKNGLATSGGENLLHDSGHAHSAVVTGWRNAWSISPLALNKASRFAARHNFIIANPATTDVTNTAVPDGDGFGAFIVNEGTGALSIAGQLADGSKLLCATFIGQDGEVLLYTSLHGNRGSICGQLTVTPVNAPTNNTVIGALTWLKPALLPKDKDKAYQPGFGPEAFDAMGSTYIPPLAGQRVLDLDAPAASPVTATNAQLSFILGGLDLAIPDSIEFSQPIRVHNPKATGLTNTATVAAFSAVGAPNPNPNKVAITTFAAPTGAFAGSFTLPGTPLRKAPFAGLIVRIFDDLNVTSTTGGYGYFLLPQSPTGSQTVTTSPTLSGRVQLAPEAGQ